MNRKRNQNVYGDEKVELEGGQAVSRGTETVLLVEDEEVVRKLIGATLSRRGYTVLEADDGTAALEIALNHPGPIQLLLTDMMLPRMNGKTLAEELQRLWPTLRIVYMSGYADSSFILEGVLEPGAPFIQKPFQTEALVRKVREVLDAPPTQYHAR